ncbi:hypothetical protein SAE02_63160 [Skermanella aerolata]|uniref:Uncharacterized protein n=1 Tax=Skermanella aerolata TaxID=393310 RepID=A0A512E099_9PROT|nr:hypothetical protein [Skermanella aerolata]KJB90489.1 hypothetical protein N826_39365 [Skermanella aerolata KACC 11604]GEO42168.1 hypothetical protein SAE02_63160 [Skermanella aerolata]
MTRKDPAFLLRVRQAIEEGGDRRPALHQWMAGNHDDLVALFEDVRLNWPHLTTVFAELGFRNLDGSDLKPETVRRTWFRVRQRRQQIAARMASRAPAAVEVFSPAASLQSLPSKPPTAPADDPMTALMAEMNRRSGRI